MDAARTPDRKTLVTFGLLTGGLFAGILALGVALLAGMAWRLQREMSGNARP